MKNMNNKKKDIDPILEAKKSAHFSGFAREAKARMRLGLEIYRVREALGMSQQVLARKAQTTQKVVSRTENGDVNIGFALLNRIGSALKFSHENWGRIFDFSVPNKLLLSGVDMTSSNTGVRKESLSKV